MHEGLRDFPWVLPSGTPLSSANISKYIPPLVILRIQSWLFLYMITWFKFLVLLLVFRFVLKPILLLFIGISSFSSFSYFVAHLQDSFVIKPSSSHKPAMLGLLVWHNTFLVEQLVGNDTVCLKNQWAANCLEGIV